MPWNYYGQVVGSESRAMMLTDGEELSLDALRAFLSVCEGMPGAALVAIDKHDDRLRLSAEVRTNSSVPLDGPQLCSDCDGTGLTFQADDPCQTCAGTGHPLPANATGDHPTMPMQAIAMNGGNRG